MAASYADKLKDPRWKKKRLEIMERDGWKCQFCYESEETLAVHHKYYVSGRAPWDYPDDCYVTLCEFHHKNIHKRLNDRDYDSFCEVKREIQNGLCVCKTDEILLARKIWNILHCNKDGLNLLNGILDSYLKKEDIYNSEGHEVDCSIKKIEPSPKSDF